MSGGISIEVGWVTIHSARKVYLSLDRHLAVKRANHRLEIPTGAKSLLVGSVEPRSRRVTRCSYKAPIRREAPVDHSRATAQALPITSAGAAIWKFTPLKGCGNRFKVQDYANRDGCRGNAVKLWHQWPVQMTGPMIAPSAPGRRNRLPHHPDRRV